MNPGRAIAAIKKAGVLLVFPLQNRPEPRSLWSAFFPREAMRWEWDDSGDDRVASLWRLREELSRSREVVYAKWYQGRATFFSRECLVETLAVLGSTGRDAEQTLSGSSRDALEALRMDSPVSTRMLKEATGLRGRTFEADYQRALKALWSGLWIVGFGEIDDGAFPSLAIGATQILFEDLWAEAAELGRTEAEARLHRRWGEGSLFLRQLGRLRQPVVQGSGIEGKP